MPAPTDVGLKPYPGLPPGAFDAANLPPQAVAAFGNTDQGVWSAAVTMYVNTVDPRTGQPYHHSCQDSCQGSSRDSSGVSLPLADAADGAVRLAASMCRSVAIDYSAGGDERAAQLVAKATGHLAAAADHIEHCAGVLDETVIGPDGELTTGRQLQLLQRRDETLARQRSDEGDSRHTERALATGWRVVAAAMLGLLDVLLLWKPLLNLSWEASSGSVFRWVVAACLAILQVLSIEWAARFYVDAERASTDRRGAVGDYNRAIRSGRIGAGLPMPDASDVGDADRRLTQAYRWLVVTAACVAVIGGVRVAVLAKRAALPSYEAAIFGTIVGFVLGGVVVQLARLYCRGNLLGDRLRVERERLAEFESKIQHARGVVAEQREHAVAALTAADVAAEHAANLRNQVAADSWRAVQLAWTWFGLPHARLDYAEFQQEALPMSADADAGRAKVRESLRLVNEWLADRPHVFVSLAAPAPALTAGTSAAASALVPAELTARPTQPTVVRQPTGGRVVIRGSEPVDVPIKPEPPHGWILAGAAATLIAAVVAALLAPGPEGAEVVSVISQGVPRMH